MVGTGVRVRLLGPVEVVVAGSPQAVNGLRRKAVLATLALHAGRVVSVDRLLDAVWGDQLPATAANTLQRHVSYVRASRSYSHDDQQRPSRSVAAPRRTRRTVRHCPSTWSSSFSWALSAS
ncbi:winged helix-turn-helix domain-containing protein [Micromonospora vinacea]|uniref:AfsR/SARP family transcriptional regulator n=1 Tax=Micromonospora vinacea TaxID=709878 RepID=UPI0034556CAE